MNDVIEVGDTVIPTYEYTLKCMKSCFIPTGWVEDEVIDVKGNGSVVLKRGFFSQSTNRFRHIDCTNLTIVKKCPLSVKDLPDLDGTDYNWKAWFIGVPEGSKCLELHYLRTKDSFLQFRGEENEAVRKALEFIKTIKALP
jgi:hypothetical protein